MRRSWDDVWMGVAREFATRSLCIRSQVAAVIVTANNEMVSPGYNGPPAGLKFTAPCDTWCQRAANNGLSNGIGYGLQCPTIHAEVNAVMRADWTLMQGGTFYGTRTPCHDCVKVIGGSGVKRCVFPVLAMDELYGPDGIVNFLTDCGVEVVPVESYA